MRNLVQKVCIYFQCLTGCRPIESAYMAANPTSFGPPKLQTNPTEATTSFQRR